MTKDINPKGPKLRQLKDRPDWKPREEKMMKAKAALSGEMKAWADKFDLSGSEVLALCAYMTGAAIAMQDQRSMTRDLAMEIVTRNIEAGNAAVIEGLLSATGGRA